MTIMTRKGKDKLSVSATAIDPNASRLSLLLWAGIIALVAATLVAYIPAIQSAYIWDDDSYVQNNFTLRSVSGLARIWADPTATPQYYPLVHTTFWMEYHLWGLQPLGFHLVNVLLHACTALLIWRALRGLKVPGAYLAAAIFALHPVHVESVAWITERKNVLSGLFYVLSLLAYLRFDPLEENAAPAKHAWFWYAGSLLLFVCALLSKSVTCSLPAILLILIWWKRGRIGWKNIAAVMPMLIIGAVSGLLTAYLEKYHVKAMGQEWALGVIERSLVAGRVVWFYAGKVLWPHPIMFFYPRWVINAHVWWQYLFPLAALAVIVALWLGRRRIGRGPLAAVLFFIVTLTPALGFFNVYPMRFSWVADHFQYLASLGIIVLASALLTKGVGKWIANPSLAFLVTAILPAALAVGVWHQSLKYQDAETLWRDTLAKNPSAWMAHNNLGAILWGSGRREEAVAQYTEAMKGNPDDASVLTNYGVLMESKGRTDEAIACWQKALRLESDLFTARSFLAFALLGQGKTDEGRYHLSEALRARPNNPVMEYNIGMGWLSLDNMEEAFSHLSRAVQLDPSERKYHVSLAIVCLKKGDKARAAGELAAASQMPTDVNGHLLLAALWAQADRPEEMAGQYRQALKVQPNLVAALNGLAWELATSPQANLRDGAEAVRLANAAYAQSGGKDFNVLDTLAAAYAETGQFEQAVKTAQDAVLGATVAGQTQSIEEMKARLSLYRQQKPYHREPPLP